MYWSVYGPDGVEYTPYANLYDIYGEEVMTSDIEVDDGELLCPDSDLYWTSDLDDKALSLRPRSGEET